MKGRDWTSADIRFLVKNYPKRGKGWCMEMMNRSEANIRYTASKLRIYQDKNSPFFKDWQKRAAQSKVGKKRPEHSELMKQMSKEGRLFDGSKLTDAQRKKMSENMKKIIKRDGHPRGFLGGKHTEESKKKMSEASKKMWSDEKSYVNSEEYRQMLSDKSMKLQQSGKFKGRYSRSKKGTYNINGKKIYFRSMWEANYALYLDFLINQKQNIFKWEFEVDTFWFEQIKRGVRSYKPDFKVGLMNGEIEYHEVKGWMDGKSKTKLTRMAKYYPDVKIILVDQKPYKEIIKKLNGVIKFFK